VPSYATSLSPQAVQALRRRTVATAKVTLERVYAAPI
jgi:hypothetical protein